MITKILCKIPFFGHDWEPVGVYSTQMDTSIVKGIATQLKRCKRCGKYEAKATIYFSKTDPELLVLKDQAHLNISKVDISSECKHESTSR